jgi:8-oxo-dGTP pyrophosphatase MutT (NUDIX family)
VIEAAGGAVCRRREDGALEVLVVHRPRYDDWSLPKGKLDPGESAEDAARREVEEETGFRCELGAPLPSVRYLDHRGRPKRVRYWTMRPVGGAFTPNHEVDEVRWLIEEEALVLLSYAHDRVVVEALRDRPG